MSLFPGSPCPAFPQGRSGRQGGAAGVGRRGENGPGGSKGMLGRAAQGGGKLLFPRRQGFPAKKNLKWQKSNREKTRA